MRNIKHRIARSVFPRRKIVTRADNKGSRGKILRMGQKNEERLRRVAPRLLPPVFSPLFLRAARSAHTIYTPAIRSCFQKSVKGALDLPYSVLRIHRMILEIVHKRIFEFLESNTKWL